MTRVLVCGGRDYRDHVRVYTVLDHYHAGNPFAILIEGEADGADKMSREWAEARGVPVLPFPADWTDLTTPPVVLRYRRDGTPYNAAAGGVRNQRMLDEGKPDVCIAFPGGRGTGDMCQRAHRAMLPVLVVPG